MDTVHYDSRKTAPLFVDACNDFLSEGGKLWPLLTPIAEDVGLLDKLRTQS